MMEFLGYLVLAWLVILGFMDTMAIIFLWVDRGISPLEHFRRAAKYGDDAIDYLDERSRQDKEDE